MMSVLALAAVLASATAWSADLAKVNGQVITDRDLEIALSGLNEGQRDKVLSDALSRMEVLDRLIDEEVLAQQGEAEKMDQDQTFKDALKVFRRQYLANRVLQKHVAPKITDKAVKAHYESNKREYSTDAVHVQHILLETEAQALDMLKKAKAADADFQELAEKNSKDPSAKNNRGDLGVVTRSSPFVPEFKNAAFDAEIDEVIGPVKTAFGYHLIKVVDKKIGKPLDFSDVELRVRNDYQQVQVEKYLDQVKKKAKIAVDEKAVNRK